jgi:mRNA interferase ChpB
MKQRKPQQGDIYLLSMNPTLGTEIQGKRPALVLSNAVSNQHGRVLMAPITQGANLDRVRGWATPLTGAGTKTQGAAIINQARFLDYRARRAKFIETTPDEVTEDALARLQATLDRE